MAWRWWTPRDRRGLGLGPVGRRQARPLTLRHLLDGEAPELPRLHTTPQQAAQPPLQLPPLLATSIFLDKNRRDMGKSQSI
jgi:hypothetical protein